MTKLREHGIPTTTATAIAVAPLNSAPVCTCVRRERTEADYLIMHLSHTLRMVKMAQTLHRQSLISDAVLNTIVKQLDD
jgi:hypothetical protein